MNKILFTSEQVSSGHPDKVCDQISDAVLDYCLSKDPNSRVACETFGKNYNIVVGGEITTKAEFIHQKTIEKIVKKVLFNIGVPDIERYTVTDFLDSQSGDISMGVDIGGAGDQGIVFGYATDETEEYMPLAWVLATEALIELRKLNSGILLPDAKSQVTIDYTGAKPLVDTFLISTQHIDSVSQQDVMDIVIPIMTKVVLKRGLNTDFKILINPTGRFSIGGFIGDAGLTGRKIIADTYGGYARHGGGAFSGKDPTKVDRSGAYMARWLTKNIVALGIAKRCEIQIGYAIGVKEPVSLFIETFGTCKMDTDKLADLIISKVDLSPQGIINRFQLKNPIYHLTSSYGHFGKENLPWERLDLIL